MGRVLIEHGAELRADAHTRRAQPVESEACQRQRRAATGRATRGSDGGDGRLLCEGEATADRGEPDSGHRHDHREQSAERGVAHRAVDRDAARRHHGARHAAQHHLRRGATDPRQATALHVDNAAHVACRGADACHGGRRSVREGARHARGEERIAHLGHGDRDAECARDALRGGGRRAAHGRFIGAEQRAADAANGHRRAATVQPLARRGAAAQHLEAAHSLARAGDVARRRQHGDAHIAQRARVAEDGTCGQRAASTRAEQHLHARRVVVEALAREGQHHSARGAARGHAAARGGGGDAGEAEHSRNARADRRRRVSQREHVYERALVGVGRAHRHAAAHVGVVVKVDGARLAAAHGDRRAALGATTARVDAWRRGARSETALVPRLGGTVRVGLRGSAAPRLAPCVVASHRLHPARQKARAAQL
eukprot:scaffold118619_cov72-Phaeocystis_antarctica.AAC.1